MLVRDASQVKVECRKSLPAEIDSTVVTVLASSGEWVRSDTSARALQAPEQRVQLRSSPTA